MLSTNGSPACTHDLYPATRPAVTSEHTAIDTRILIRPGPALACPLTSRLSACPPSARPLASDPPTPLRVSWPLGSSRCDTESVPWSDLVTRPRCATRAHAREATGRVVALPGGATRVGSARPFRPEHAQATCRIHTCLSGRQNERSPRGPALTGRPALSGPRRSGQATCFVPSCRHRPRQVTCPFRSEPTSSNDTPCLVPSSRLVARRQVCPPGAVHPRLHRLIPGQNGAWLVTGQAARAQAVSTCLVPS
jgi:hypothetical protein